MGELPSYRVTSEIFHYCIFDETERILIGSETWQLLLYTDEEKLLLHMNNISAILLPLDEFPTARGG